MPVTRSRTYLADIGLEDSNNTTGFLFGDEDSNPADRTTPTAQVGNTDAFPSLFRQQAYPSMVSLPFLSLCLCATGQPVWVRFALFRAFYVPDFLLLVILPISETWACSESLLWYFGGAVALVHLWVRESSCPTRRVSHSILFTFITFQLLFNCLPKSKLDHQLSRLLLHLLYAIAPTGLLFTRKPNHFPLYTLIFPCKIFMSPVHRGASLPVSDRLVNLFFASQDFCYFFRCPQPCPLPDFWP